MWEYCLNLIYHIFSWVLNRPNLAIRIIEDNPEKEEGGLEFEIENRSKNPTSLSPQISVTFLTLERKTEKMDFDVRELDRHLPQYEPKILSASARFAQPERFNGWFRVYSFRPTKGRTANVRIRNALFEEIGILRFLKEKTWYKLTGDVNVKDSTSVDEYRASQRTRGPH